MGEEGEEGEGNTEELVQEEEAILNAFRPALETDLSRIELADMSNNQLLQRIKELSGFEPKSMQLQAIRAVACFGSSLLVIAPTGYGKSLIINTLPLLSSLRQRTLFIIVPLKHIQKQQLQSVLKLPGGRPTILDAERNTKRLRRDIGQGKFTHGSKTKLSRLAFCYTNIYSASLHEPGSYPLR